MKNYSIYETSNNVREKKQKLTKPKALTWKVFEYDINAHEIKVADVFNSNWVFRADMYYDYKHCKNENGEEDFDKFAKAVLSNIMYYYWSKCEYEIIVSSWPSSLNEAELKALMSELEKQKAEYPDRRNYYVYPPLEGAEKVDVATQIIMNWEPFISYVWENRKLIAKFKQDYKFRRQNQKANRAMYKRAEAAAKAARAKAREEKKAAKKAIENKGV